MKIGPVLKRIFILQLVFILTGGWWGWGATELVEQECINCAKTGKEGNK